MSTSCPVHLTVCSYQVTYAFLSQSTLHSGCRFESHCSHLNFRYRPCFEQGVSWHSGNYRVWIHSDTSTWHDKHIQSYYYLQFIKMIGWHWHLIVFSPSDQETTSFNEPIILFDLHSLQHFASELKKDKYIWNKIEETTFADINFLMFLVLFSKKITF